MNYQKIYDNLISKGKDRILEGYVEKHHIIPRCIGGTDDKENLVDLTPEEHYLAHQLLVKIYPNEPKLIRAATMMIPNRHNNKMYGWLKRKFSKVQSESQSGSGNSQYGTKWITDGERERKILKNIPVPENWVESRLISYKRKQKKEQKKAAEVESKLNELRKLHEIYVVEGFDGVLNRGYAKTKQNLVKQFAKYLPEFVPQNGKRRKIIPTDRASERV